MKNVKCLFASMLTIAVSLEMRWMAYVICEAFIVAEYYFPFDVYIVTRMSTSSLKPHLNKQEPHFPDLYFHFMACTRFEGS